MRPALGDNPEEGLVDVCAQAIAESNKLVAEREGALVSFDEPPLLPDDLVGEAERMCEALGEDERMTQIQGVFLAAGVIADPRPRYADAAEREAFGRSLSGELECAGELRYAGGMQFDALGPGEQLRAVLVDAEAITNDRQDVFVPDDDTRLHYLWSRIVVLAACLLRSPPLSALDRSGSGDSELHRAIELAVGLLSESPVKNAPICFEHGRAATNIRFQALELLPSWLDRALGFLTESERVGLIRDRADFAALRGILAQALIGAWCSSEC